MRAGVSIMTVSKALRDAKDISGATRQRIRLIAEELGYMPDIAARGLRSRSSQLFGVVISSLTNPIYARILLAIEDRAHALGYDVIFAHSLNQPEREAEAIRHFLSRRVDGMFISPVYRLESTASAYQQLQAQGTPTVILGHRAPFCSQFSAVETDDGAAAAAVTRQLLELGHRRIAWLDFVGAGGDDPHYSRCERALGVAETLAGAGLAAMAAISARFSSMAASRAESRNIPQNKPKTSCTQRS